MLVIKFLAFFHWFSKIGGLTNEVNICKISSSLIETLSAVSYHGEPLQMHVFSHTHATVLGVKQT